MSKQVCVDGCFAAAHAAYRINDVAFIYPITPSSTMGELVDLWCDENKLNIWNQKLYVKEMQSEGGAAGAVHGALACGSLAVTFTASQGLLLMVPNLYKIAGEQLPCVIHVASRAIAGNALSIYGDHSDIMGCRAVGWALVSSFNVQQAHDFAIISQIVSLKTRVPFMHFFDGFRTSHEVNKIDVVDDSILRRIMPWQAIEEHRRRALSPNHPHQQGTAQGPDIFFQLAEQNNQNYTSVGQAMKDTLQVFAEATGREYKPFEVAYFGSTSPSMAIITMGSSYSVVKATLEADGNDSVMVVGVHLFRPWFADDFLSSLPSSITRVTVLDRTKEAGSQGEPLFLDVCTSLMVHGRGHILVTGGRYGLGSKDFNPRMVQSVVKNTLRKNISDIKMRFVVGIEDDVTKLSLNMGPAVNIIPDSVTQCVFWGFGSDGTVGATKDAVKILSEGAPDSGIPGYRGCQSYAAYDAKKSGGLTISYLRFSKDHSIDYPFLIEDASAQYVACHNSSYVETHRYDVTKYCKKGGTFFLNTPIASIEDPQEQRKALESLVSPRILRTIAQRKINFYLLDANKLALDGGLGRFINQICLVVFFRLSGVLPIDTAKELLHISIKKTYSAKGDIVINNNVKLVDYVISNPDVLKKIEPSPSWRSLSDGDRSFLARHVVLIDDRHKEYLTDIVEPMNRNEGDSISVSKLKNLMNAGRVPLGTAKYEKRNPNPSSLVPKWNSDACTQCNQCSLVCPHAAIRPFLITQDEVNNAPYPKGFESVKANGSDLAGKRYTLKISVLDCTGCNACVEICPEEPKALTMKNIEDFLPTEIENWNYAMTIPERGSLVNDRASIRGSQFYPPLIEFSGACLGCGETPYFKLLTQLFGERMIIANATGCSTIWGGSGSSNPYTTNQKGHGPAWANSLFEDNAEFGFGMWSSMKARRDRLTSLIKSYVGSFSTPSSVPSGVKSLDHAALLSLFTEWLAIRHEKNDKCTLLYDRLEPFLKEYDDPSGGGASACVKNIDSGAWNTGEGDDGGNGGSTIATFDTKKDNGLWLLKQINSDRDMFPKLSQWIVGGDGWAYDIGFGGLDHTLAFGQNDVNILVVDTEMYSNTGGQASKSTPVGAMVKMAAGGKTQNKKDIGAMLMTYEHIYVASCSLGNMPQLVQALSEADAYNGPSFVVCYAPCVQHGIRPNGLSDMIEESRFAVDTGYWPLYRYNPSLISQGQNPFILDSKKLRLELTSFLKREGRFVNLNKKHPTLATEIWAHVNNDVAQRLSLLKKKAIAFKKRGSVDNGKTTSVRVFYASETGTARRVATDWSHACSFASDADACDDVDIIDLENSTTVLFIATCGQGKMPQNGKKFYSALQSRTTPLEKCRFMVVGLGDSSYFFYCQAAKDVEQRLKALGGECLAPMGECDDCSEGGMEVGLHAWVDQSWSIVGCEPPSEVPHIIAAPMTFSLKAVLLHDDDEAASRAYYASVAASLVILNDTSLMCPITYDRDFRRMTFAAPHLSFALGDALEVFPMNDEQRVTEFLHSLSPDLDSRTVMHLEQLWHGMQGDATLSVIFTQILDVFGKPTQHFMRQLATFCTDDNERALMLDPAFLVAGAKESGLTFADVLLKFNKVCHPPLPALLSMIPVMKPRAYSIASNPSADGHIELCVLINTFSCQQGERVGLCCGYLRSLRAGDKVMVRIKCGSMEAPTLDQPVVCVGIGSGLAPHMAFLRERVEAAMGGCSVAPFALYFGNRNKSAEFLYHEELQNWAETFSWLSVNFAWSRDPNEKREYVQDVVARTDSAFTLLCQPHNGVVDGRLYVCGNRNLPVPLQAALKKCFSRHMSEEEAGVAVRNLFIQGRAAQEVW